MMKSILVVLWVGLSASLAFAQDGEGWIPFAIPHQFPDDSRVNMADTPTGQSVKPAGSLGFVRAGPDGRLYTGDQRIRFLGVNITAGSAFPSAADARITADRLSHLGVNCVRFHHMEAPWVADNITTGEKGTSRKLNPQTLDRLDRFIAELKARGIYINMNLLVSRTFFPADGLPVEIKQVDWKRQHVIGFWYQPLIDLQKEYARNLLTHRNPYTKLTYTEDPAVAVIEINNENGLFQGWMSNQIDNMPDVFTADLQRQWNDYLAKRYDNTEALAKAWGAKNEPLGGEMLTNNDFVDDIQHWTLERHEGAIVEPKINPSGYKGHSALQLHVVKGGSTGWHVQFNQPGLATKKGQLYTASFAAKADKSRKIAVGLGQAHAPWQSVGLSTEIELTNQWQTFTFTFIATTDDQNARFGYSNLSQTGAKFEFSDPSLKTGGRVGITPDQKLENHGIALLKHQSATPHSVACRADWLQFLHDTERAYWITMRDYVKQELGAKALTLGTIVGCSTPNLMNEFDIVDAHSYWQHPHFPGRSWDSGNWEQHKSSMVDHPESIMTGLAAKRVRGKPFFVTEFNCGQPNPYGAEGMLLVPAYAALQDWDGIFYFDYGTTANERINSYFDISGFPTKLVNLPIAAALFRRGDVQIAKQELSVPYGIDREMEILSRSWAWGLGDTMRAGLAGEAAMAHRVNMTLDEAAKNSEMPVFTKSGEKRYESDTGELVWDATKAGGGWVTINTPRTVAVVGHVSRGQTIRLGSASITFTGDQDWVTAALMLTDGESFANKPKRAILVLTGNVANKGMKLRELGGDRITCDNNWGAGPAVVKPVKALVQIIGPDRLNVTVCPLNANGERGHVMEGMNKRRGDFGFPLAADTLWYEVQWQ